MQHWGWTHELYYELMSLEKARNVSSFFLLKNECGSTYELMEHVVHENKLVLIQTCMNI